MNGFNFNDRSHKLDELLRCKNPDFNQQLFDEDFDNDEPTYFVPSHIILKADNVTSLKETWLRSKTGEVRQKYDIDQAHAVSFLFGLILLEIEAGPTPEDNLVLAVLRDFLKSSYPDLDRSSERPNKAS